MARVNLPVQPVVRTGLNPSLTAADDVENHVFDNDGRVFLYVVNGLVDVDVTVVSGFTRLGLALADVTVTVPANHSRLIGPFPKDVFDQTGTGKVHVNIDDDSNVTLAAISLP